MKFGLIAAIALSVVMAFFAVQNSQHTQVTFLGWSFDGPLVIILLLTFGTGVITTLLAMLPGSLRKSIEISKLNSRVAENLSKLEAIKNTTAVNKIHEKETLYEQQR
jgi:uncharacterized integral membrane protein